MRIRFNSASALIHALRRAGFQRLFGAPSAALPAAEAVASAGAGPAVSGVPWSTIEALLRHAHDHTDFYRARLDSAGWPALSPAAFSELAPLTREDVVTNGSRIAAAGAAGGGLSRASGGSGGAAVVIPVDRATYARYTAGTWAGLAWWGIEMPTRTLVLLGASPGSALRDAAKRGKDLLLNWLRVPVVEGFDARISDTRRRAERFAPDLIYGYPSAVAALATEAQRAGWRPRRAARAILLTGEPIYDFQRRRIERVFNAPVIGEYGSGEVGTIGFQCPRRRLHVNTANVCVQITPGSAVLITQLHNRRFPLIRYDIGDRGAWQDDGCPCGRPGPLLRVIGRAGDRLVDSGGGETEAREAVDRFFDALPEALQGRVRILHPRPGVVAIAGSDGAAPAAAIAAAGTVFGGSFSIVAAPPLPWRRTNSGKLPYFLRGEESA